MPDRGTPITQTAVRRPTQNERILAVLNDRDWHTATQLYRTGCVLHSRISGLRKRGYVIESRHVDGVGADAWEYRLVAMPEEATATTAAVVSSDIPASSDLPSADWGDGMSEPVQLVIV